MFQDPCCDIPKGTLYALLTGTVSYLLVGLTTASVMVRSIPGISNSSLVPQNATGIKYGFGEYFEVRNLRSSMRRVYACRRSFINNRKFNEFMRRKKKRKNTGTLNLYNITGYFILLFQSLEVISAFSPLFYAAVLIGGFSSALSTLQSAPRVLRLLSKDGLYPYTGWFSRGSHYRAYLPTAGIAVTFILVGKFPSLCLVHLVLIKLTLNSVQKVFL